MKTRLFVIAVLLAAAAAFYVVTIRPMLQPAPPRISPRLLKTLRPPDVEPPAVAVPEPRIEVPALTPPPLAAKPAAPSADPLRPVPMEVPIQSSTTIDFSTGAPIIKTQGEDQIALEKALKEMAEATKDTTFKGTPPRP